MSDGGSRFFYVSLGTSLTAIAVAISALIWIVGYVDAARLEVKQEIILAEQRLAQALQTHGNLAFHQGLPDFVRQQLEIQLTPIQTTLNRLDNKLDRF